VLSGLLGGWTNDVRAESTLTKAIPSQPVAAALAEFAHQTGLQFIYVSRVAAERTSPGARAGLAPVDALRSLLDGTGLDFKYLNERTVRIFESTTPATVAPSSTASASTAPVHGRTPTTGKSEEIVVIGSRGLHGFGGDEDTRTVAASVSIVSGSSLEAQKLEQLSDYAAYLAGVDVVTFGTPGSAAVWLRGISTFTSAATVAFYLDDTPIGATGPWANANSESLDLMPYDLERLEVRRGPQGTHFGANSETGLIRYVLQQPNLSVVEARVGADASAIRGASGTGASLRFMVNAPIVEDELAVRASAYDTYTPGYIDNAYSGATDVNAVHQMGGRVALLWRPADSFSVKVNAFWPRIESESNSDVSSKGVDIVPGTGDAYIVKGFGSYGDLTEYHAFQQPFRKEIDYYAATVEWNAGTLEVLSATAWSSSRSDYVFDYSQIFGPSFPEWSDSTIEPGLAAQHWNIDVEKFTEEIHVASAAGTRVSWLLGAFYDHERATDESAVYAYDKSYRPIAYFAPSLTSTTVHDTFNELAAFGELTWHATGDIDLTGGIRYAHDDQQFSARDSGSIADPAYLSDHSAEGVATWMLAVSDRIVPDIMFYGRVATGSQPGSTNGVLQDVPRIVKPEAVTSYELGVKSEILDREVLIDFSVFYMNWNDIQLGTCFTGGCGYVNGGEATSQGLELTSSYSPLPGLTLSYIAAYTRSELTSVRPGVGSALTGYQLPDIPRWAMSLTANYDREFTDAWHAHAGGALRYVGERWGEIGVQSRSAGGAPTMELPAYCALDLNASIAKGPLTIRAFIRNLTDTRGRQQGIVLGDAYINSPDVYDPPAALELRILQPRTIGLGFDYAY
jgi:iron complex outermembrane recepter protein